MMASEPTRIVLSETNSYIYDSMDRSSISGSQKMVTSSISHSIFNNNKSSQNGEKYMNNNYKNNSAAVAYKRTVSPEPLGRRIKRRKNALLEGGINVDNGVNVVFNGGYKIDESNVTAPFSAKNFFESASAEVDRPMHQKKLSSCSSNEVEEVTSKQSLKYGISSSNSSSPSKFSRESSLSVTEGFNFPRQRRTRQANREVEVVVLSSDSEDEKVAVISDGEDFKSKFAKKHFHKSRTPVISSNFTKSDELADSDDDESEDVVTVDDPTQTFEICGKYPFKVTANITIGRKTNKKTGVTLASKAEFASKHKPFGGYIIRPTHKPKAKIVGNGTSSERIMPSFTTNEQPTKYHVKDTAYPKIASRKSVTTSVTDSVAKRRIPSLPKPVAVSSTHMHNLAAPVKSVKRNSYITNSHQSSQLKTGGRSLDSLPSKLCAPKCKVFSVKDFQGLEIPDKRPSAVYNVACVKCQKDKRAAFCDRKRPCDRCKMLKRSAKCTYHPNAYVENRKEIEAYEYFAHEKRKQKHREYNAAKKAEKAERFSNLPSRVVPVQVPIRKRTPSTEKLSTNPSSPTSMTNSTGSVPSSKSTSLSPVVPGAAISTNFNLANVSNKLYSPPSLPQNLTTQFKTSNSSGARGVSSSENHVEADDFYKSDSEDDDLRGSGKNLIHSRLKTLQKRKKGSARVVEIDDDSNSPGGPVEVSDGTDDDLSSNDDKDLISKDDSDYDLFNERPVSKNRKASPGSRKRKSRSVTESDELERQSRVLKELYYEKRDIDEIYTGRRRRRAARVANYREDDDDESDDSADGYNDAAERDEMLILSEDEETRRALAGDLPENYFENKEVHLARQREREEKMLRQSSLHVVDDEDDDLSDLSD
ncbi:unnamed protein product [Ambrosiozyma monospora]|uniref:Unnamed protein product n=1 Tax=Ambrosiozyma monospora TaxID=43982 RepID=A0ACB5SS53_AMBMO|nr:unnamed protein product [Ambrosiozyma monospora]